MKDKVPPWVGELILKFKAGVSHTFILWGNIYDLQMNMRGEYLPLRGYLKEIFEQRDLAVRYSISEGLVFANADMERSFRNGLPDPKPQSSGASKVIQKTQESLHNNQRAATSTSKLVGDTPVEVLKSLDWTLAKGSPKCVLVIDFAHNVFPSQMAGQNPAERATVEILERWANDSRIGEAGNIVVLLSPSLAGLNECLRSSQSGTVAIRIPRPDEKTRTARWAYHVSQNGVKFAQGLTPEFLGRVTNGLSLRQIDSIYLLAREKKVQITLSLIKEEKQKLFETEFGDRIKIKVPNWGFDSFGGKANLKKYMLEIRDCILSGALRRAPMGILASGPPGTGKTFFFECWAYECGFNFIEIVNPRSKWVGESEEITEKIFAAIDDLSPAIVVEDEADQSEISRDSPNGDTGVSNRLRQMKFKFTSDPKRRGKVIWIRISNRSDLIDAAYKREGRSDDTIPFLMPEQDEYESIFRVMLARYGIQTDITDFTPFAEEVAAKIYCTGASVEWMVLEADKYAGREGKDRVEAEHLRQAIDDWEMKLNPAEIDRQTILAIQGSSKRLRPENWQKMLDDAQNRLQRMQLEEVTVTPEIAARYR